MSTKATIAHGSNFHFYHEALDYNHMYLELEGMEFEAGYGWVMASIPIPVRTNSESGFRLVGKCVS
jgi:hypothetical protein